jgi:serine-type D-Ala-D-Ala carboxypeptidase (penicillin-binding protein 5/6)
MIKLASSFIFTLILTLNLQAEPLKLNVKAEAVILMNADTGAVLFEKNSRKLYSPASTTKVATALYALKLKGDKLNEIIAAEQEDLATVAEEEKRNANYKLPPYWLVKDGTHIGLKKGEKMSFLDLLYGMMLASGNDASNVIARFAGGSIPRFMAGLNEYLKEIHCQNTTFYNPHGLFHPKHQSTAYDMALMTREALKSPVFCKIVSTLSYPRPLTNKQPSATFVQHNKLLKHGAYYYPKAIGVKTGYHSKAEHTFIAAARQDQRTLIAVLLKTKERSDMFLDAIKLFEEAFNQSKVEKILLAAGPQTFEFQPEGARDSIQTYLQEDLKISYYPAEEPSYKSYLQWDRITLPIDKGQQVGELKIVQNDSGNTLATIPLFTQNDVKETWQYWISHHLTFGYAMLALAVLVSFLLLWQWRSRPSPRN